jgi:hypothetical protein
VALLLVLAVAVAVAGRGDPPIEKQVQQRVAPALAPARQGRYEEAWRRMDLHAGHMAIARELACAPHSHGRVQAYFVRAQCRWLHRGLLPGTDAHGNTVLVSIAWVQMADATEAVELRRLADQDGTGDMLPLPGRLVHLDGVRFTGRYHRSRRAGPLVVIAEAEPARGHPDAVTLLAAARAAAELPPR